MKPNESRREERGMALVISMLVLLVVTVIGVLLMLTVSTGRRMTGQGLRYTESLNVAEAGVNEALARIRNGDASLNTANPRSVAQIFLTPSGSVPVLGTDSTGLATSQPSGSWLSYSTAGRSANALTIEFKTDPGRTGIYRYDATSNPKVHFGGTGLPVYKVTSTGTVGTAKRTVVTEVIQKPFVANAKAALAAAQPINFIGNAVVCGYNHTADTPNDAGKNGRDANPQCHVPWEINSGDLPAAWSTGTVSNGGAAYQTGANPVWAQNQTGFYTGPWDCFGMSQAEFLAWIGSPTNGAPADLHGVYYIDNNATVGDQSTSLGIHGGDGEGLLYIDGDLTVNAQFYYRGMIYVEGDLNMNGQAWVLGGMVVKGRATVRMNGGATILYSSDAITRALAKYGGTFVTLSWREKQ